MTRIRQKFEPGLVKGYRRAVYEDAQHVQWYRQKHSRSVWKLRDLVEQRLVCQHVMGRVFEGGSGTGRFTETLDYMGEMVLAMDTSEPMLKSVRTLNLERTILVRGDIEHLPVCSESFDTVVSIRLIFSLPQYREILRECFRVLRPGGRMIFDVESGEHDRFAKGLAGALGLYRPRQHRKPIDFSVRLTRKEIKELAEFLGGRCLLIQPYNIFCAIWVTQIPVIDKVVKRFFELPWMPEAGAWLERVLERFLPPVLALRHFIVLEKLSSGKG